MTALFLEHPASRYRRANFPQRYCRDRQYAIIKIKKAGTVFIHILLLCSAGMATYKQSHSNEQRHFSAEASTTKEPMPIPKSALAILTKDGHVQNLLEDENISSAKIPLSWFSAATVHLRSPEKVDLIVMGEGPLRGANVVTFWIFQSTTHGYRLILTAPAHDLVVKNTRWNGYHDIILMSATAEQISITLYKFDGKRYREYKSETEPIK